MRMLSHLADALGGLGRKLASQGRSLREVASLAPRAEETALRARLFALGCGGAEGPWARDLSGDIDRLAAQATGLALRAEPMAATDEAQAAALAADAAGLGAAAADPGRLRDSLGRLTRTMESVAAQRQAHGAIGTGLTGLAEQATRLSARAGAGAPDVAAPDAALLVARDLAALAEKASRIAAALQRDAGRGASAAAAMADRVRGMEEALPPPPAPPADASPPPPPAPLAGAYPAVPPDPPARSFGKAPVWNGVTRLT
jgi:hypothetical protein